MTPADRNYTNDRRAGKTNPDLVEKIERTDPRHPAYRRLITFNRARRRANGQVGVNPFRRMGKRRRSEISA